MDLNGLVEISSVSKLPSQVLKRTTKYTDARLKATKVNSNFIVILATLLVVSIIIVIVARHGHLQYHFHPGGNKQVDKCTAILEATSAVCVKVNTCIPSQGRKLLIEDNGRRCKRC